VRRTLLRLALTVVLRLEGWSASLRLVSRPIWWLVLKLAQRSAMSRLAMRLAKRSAGWSVLKLAMWSVAPLMVLWMRLWVVQNAHKGRIAEGPRVKLNTLMPPTQRPGTHSLVCGGQESKLHRHSLRSMASTCPGCPQTQSVAQSTDRDRGRFH
jgi:hypothetical protein